MLESSDIRVDANAPNSLYPNSANIIAPNSPTKELPEHPAQKGEEINAPITTSPTKNLRWRGDADVTVESCTDGMGRRSASISSAGPSVASNSGFLSALIAPKSEMRPGFALSVDTYQRAREASHASISSVTSIGSPTTPPAFSSPIPDASPRDLVASPWEAPEEMNELKTLITQLYAQEEKNRQLKERMEEQIKQLNEKAAEIAKLKKEKEEQEEKQRMMNEITKVLRKHILPTPYKKPEKIYVKEFFNLKRIMGLKGACQSMGVCTSLAVGVFAIACPNIIKYYITTTLDKDEFTKGGLEYILCKFVDDIPMVGNIFHIALRHAEKYINQHFVQEHADEAKSTLDNLTEDNIRLLSSFLPSVIILLSNGKKLCSLTLSTNVYVYLFSALAVIGTAGTVYYVYANDGAIDAAKKVSHMDKNAWSASRFVGDINKLFENQEEKSQEERDELAKFFVKKVCEKGEGEINTEFENRLEGIENEKDLRSIGTEALIAAAKENSDAKWDMNKIKLNAFVSEGAILTAYKVLNWAMGIEEEGAEAGFKMAISMGNIVEHIFNPKVYNACASRNGAEGRAAA